MIHRWIKAQRIGLLAYRLNTIPTILESEQVKIARMLLKEEIDSYPGFITLPPSTLHTFLNIPQNKLNSVLRTLRLDFTKVLAKLKNIQNKKSPSIANGAQIIAHYALHGTGGTARFIRFAGMVFGKDLREYMKMPGYENELLSYINHLRSNISTTEEKLDSIDNLGNLNWFKNSFYWKQVENVLYQQILSWPLLVFDGRDSGDIFGGISLPVGIDVYLDGNSKVDFKGGAVIDVSQWIKHFEKASDAAKILWKATHGNYGKPFKREINEASIVFDFSIADEIVRGVPFNVSLKDGSADAYFSQVILSRLLGKNSAISSAITGLIGHQIRGSSDFSVDEFKLPLSIEKLCKVITNDNYNVSLNATINTIEWLNELLRIPALYDILRIKKPNISFSENIANLIDNTKDYRNINFSSLNNDEQSNVRRLNRILLETTYPREMPKSRMRDKLDFEFILPTGIKDKIKYVFQSSFFERVVIPALNNEDKSKKGFESFINSNEIDQTSEINYAKYLQNVADCVQIGGWRQFNYIRCPEIAWAINSKERNLLPAEDKSVEKVLKLLQNNKSCVLEMDNEATPLTVASALYYINNTLRNSISLAVRPPMMSWSFIRAVEEELDERFWQIVWRLTGTPMKEFEIFQNSPTTQVASLHLAKALNCFSPTYPCLGNRSPDILVIIGTNKLSLTFDKMIISLSRPLAFRPILNEFVSNSHLHPIPYERMQEFLGKTRIVVFPEEHHNSHFTHPVDLDKDDLNILILLSVFRYGFTQQMASILLKEVKLKSLDIREKLQSFVTKRVIRYCNGKYHIPRKFSFVDGQEAKSTLTAKYHYFAGISLAPYVSTQDVPGLAYDSAFLPENIHEAEYHFTEAIELAKIIDDKILLGHASGSLAKIIRFADIEGWHTVCKSKHYSQDVYEVVLDLLKSRRETGYPPHPGHILNACKLATSSLKQYQHNEKTNPIQRQDIIKLYEEALDVCKDFPREYKYNRLLVTTHYATFLKKYERTNQSRIKELDEEATRLLLNDTNGNAAPGEWYELMGDENIDYSKSLQFYVWGVNWQSDWGQLWIKMFGTSFIIYGTITQISDYIKNITHEKIISILSNALKGYENFVKHVPHDLIINKRWHEGLRVFEQVWGKNPDAFQKLQQFHDIRSKILR